MGQSEKLVAFYKLTHGINKKFGPKIWCDIEVIFPKKEEKKQEEDDLVRLMRQFSEFKEEHKPNYREAHENDINREALEANKPVA